MHDTLIVASNVILISLRSLVAYTHVYVPSLFSSLSRCIYGSTVNNSFVRFFNILRTTISKKSFIIGLVSDNIRITTAAILIHIYILFSFPHGIKLRLSSILNLRMRSNTLLRLINVVQLN